MSSAQQHCPLVSPNVLVCSRLRHTTLELSLSLTHRQDLVQSPAASVAAMIHIHRAAEHISCGCTTHHNWCWTNIFQRSQIFTQPRHIQGQPDHHHLDSTSIIGTTGPLRSVLSLPCPLPTGALMHGVLRVCCIPQICYCHCIADLQQTEYVTHITLHDNRNMCVS